MDGGDRLVLVGRPVHVGHAHQPESERGDPGAAGPYRIFGDKQGLIEAVTAYGFERYLADKQGLAATDDPVEDLRRGWDLHVEFGLTRPAFYTLMYRSVRPGHQSPAAAEATRILLRQLERIAHLGRLRVPVGTAAAMIHAAAVGVTLALIARPAGERGPDLSAPVRDAVLAAIVTGDDAGAQLPGPPLSARALALDAALGEAPDGLTAAETALLRQWLRRLAEPVTPP